MAQQKVRQPSVISSVAPSPQISPQLPSVPQLYNHYVPYRASNAVRRFKGINILPLMVAAIIITLWYVVTRDSATAFLLAAPEKVIEQYGATIANGSLFVNLFTTLAEMAIGVFVGIGSAFVLGYAIAHSRLLERAVGPYVVAFQAVPIVVIAPVLIRFLPTGILTNGFICALVVFFPMLVTTVVGIRNVDPDLRLLMRSLLATRWQVFTRLEVPASLPVLFGGLKISMTLSVIGAIVSEGFSAQAGLGYMIYAARYVYDTSLVFVGIFTVTGLALILYEIIARIERRVLRWQRVK